MDTELRELERQALSNPDAKAKLDRLQCKLTGCLWRKPITVAASYNYPRQSRVIYVGCMDESCVEFEIKDYLFYAAANTRDAIWDGLSNAANQLDKCTRCGSPQGEVNKLIISIKELLCLSFSFLFCGP